MSQLIAALLQLVVALFGVDVGSHFTDRIRGGDGDVLVSRAHVLAGVARFECVASASGTCHYALYPHQALRDCARRAAGKPHGDCPPRPLRRFSVAVGDSRKLADVAGFDLCVGTDDTQRYDDCATPPRAAGR